MLQSTLRPRNVYDHRLRDAMAVSGNPRLFQDVAIPPSTRRMWAAGHVPAAVVTAFDVDLERYELLDRVDKLQRRLKQQGAVIGLLVRLLMVRGGKFSAERLADEQGKASLLKAIASATRVIALTTALRIVGISAARYQAWLRKQKGCGLADHSSCPRSFPTRLTFDEVAAMRDFVESEDYRHIAIQNLVLLAQRLGKVFASASTWYKMIKERGWNRPTKRVHPAKPKVGLRASSPNEFWHVDATVIRLICGTRIYLQGVVDNFSRKVLAWRVVDKLSSQVTRALLIQASKYQPDNDRPQVVVVTDGGPENFGVVNELLKQQTVLSRVVAQIEISFSNSLIEAVWRELKHRFLFLHVLDSKTKVQRLVDFYMRSTTK